MTTQTTEQFLRDLQEKHGSLSLISYEEWVNALDEHIDGLITITSVVASVHHIVESKLEEMQALAIKAQQDGNPKEETICKRIASEILWVRNDIADLHPLQYHVCPVCESDKITVLGHEVKVSCGECGQKYKL